MGEIMRSRIRRNRWKTGPQDLALRIIPFSAYSALCGALHNVDIGAAWKKTSNEGRNYVLIKIDDPALPAPILANLFEMSGGEHELIWSRPTRNRSGE